MKLKASTGVAAPAKTKTESIAKTSASNYTTDNSEIEKPSTSIKSQLEVLLKYLQFHKSITTIYAREMLGIMHPAGRIQTLRDRGHNIHLYWVEEVDSAGTKHKIGCYVLKHGKYEGGVKK